MLPPPKLEQGWEEFRLPKAGFSIALPPGYIAISSEDPKMTERIRAADKVHPLAMKRMRETLWDKDMEFTSGDVNTADTGFMDTLNISHTRTPEAAPMNDAALDAFRRGLEAELKKQGGTVVSAKLVDLPIGKGMLAEMTFVQDDRMGKQLKVRSFGYLVANQLDIYNVTFTTVDERLGEAQPLFEQIMKTFRVLKREESSTSPDLPTDRT